MSEASDEVWEEAEVAHSLRMVELCAMQELDVLGEVSCVSLSDSLKDQDSLE